MKWTRNLSASKRCANDDDRGGNEDRKSTRLNSSHGYISYAVFCLKKETFTRQPETDINNLGLWWWSGNSVPYPSQLPASQLARAYSFGTTINFSATLTNEDTFGYA